MKRTPAVAQDHRVANGSSIALGAKSFYDFENEGQSELTMADLVEGIHRINRWSGQSDMSVLEHSVRVAECVADMGGSVDQIACGLLHDLHEALVGDVPRPMKVAMRALSASDVSAFDVLEELAMAFVAYRFGIEFPHPDIVVEADNRVLAYEARSIFGVDPASWGIEAEPAAKSRWLAPFSGETEPVDVHWLWLSLASCLGIRGAPLGPIDRGWVPPGCSQHFDELTRAGLLVAPRHVSTAAAATYLARVICPSTPDPEITMDALSSFKWRWSLDGGEESVTATGIHSGCRVIIRCRSRYDRIEVEHLDGSVHELERPSKFRVAP